jgi:lipopolysaccharide transport system permease protein
MPHQIDHAVEQTNPAELLMDQTQAMLIEPPRRWEALELREIWRYRELLYFLTWRDVKVRYKQTAIGAAWAILQPFLTMVVFSVIFGGLIQVPSDGVPYPIFSYAALLPWTFFAGALTRSGSSLVYDANLVSKVYFPRMILPFAAVLSLLVDFAIAFIILLGMMLFYGIIPGATLITLPLFLLLAL